jgi:hypothetical protein
MFGKIKMLGMYAAGITALTLMANAANFLFDDDKEEKKKYIPVVGIPVVGDHVRIHSLKLKPDFNGLEGEVVEYITTTQRFNIVLNQNGNKRGVSLKATNLTVLATRAAAAAAARAASGAGGGAASGAGGGAVDPDPHPAGERQDDEDDRVNTDTNPDLPPAPAGSAEVPGVWDPALGKYVFFDNHHNICEARLEFNNNIVQFLTAVEYANLPLDSIWGVPVCLRYPDGKMEDLEMLKVKKGLYQLSSATQLPAPVWVDFAPTGAVGAAASAPAASAGRKRIIIKRAPHAGPEASPRVPPVGHKKRKREWTN